MGSRLSKGLLSVVTGNTSGVRGLVVDHLLRASPRAAVLAVSVQDRDRGYPVVQRFASGACGAGTQLRDTLTRGATGDPAVILRQDLLSIQRAMTRPHVILALPQELDVLPLLVELWRPRIGVSSLGDHYEPGPVLVGVDPASFTADLGCVHRAVSLWDGSGGAMPTTPAEIAARQVESADALIVPTPAGGGSRWVSGAAALIGQLNPHAALLTVPDDGDPAAGLPPFLTQPAPSGASEGWRTRLEPVILPHSPRGGGHGVGSVLWQARRPLHPERLADSLGAVMIGAARSRGHLWLCSRPDAVVSWRSAGAHLELFEADRWLEAGDRSVWEAASPQRRTLASWFWHDYYGERRNEIVFTGIDLNEQRIRSALDEALLTDTELSSGRECWTAIPDPLLGSP
ncbi:GTP-binding protein [Streptomyces sp. NPDC059761]|uniref:GTP-binding protein n=1 Tax=Streptomyces sp. NPDC059761 TaxID=3346937 RepID=UPI003647D18A